MCEKADKVVSVEFSKRRGEAIAKRHKSKENLEVIIGSLKDIKFEEKFDYITLIGMLEYAPIIYNTDDSFSDLLIYLKTLLKDNGKILIATNNKFGMRNWSTVEINDNNLEYDAVISQKDNNKCQLLTNNKLEKILEKANLGEKKYYYPLPDYKYTNVIFTKEFMPNENNLHRNITFFRDSYIVSFHENSAYVPVLKEDKNLFEFFANSYFIEAGENLKDNEIKYVSFWNNRKTEYRLKTIIKGDKVYKYPLSNLSNGHFNTIKNNIDILNNSNIKTLDEYDEEKIISRFVKNCISYDELIINEYDKGGLEKVIELIYDFQNKILNKLESTDAKNNVFDKYNIKYTDEEIKNLHFIKNGLWDLNFQNTFLIDNELYVYDQEWIEENLPIEFIIYKGILLFSELKKRIDENELYKKLNLLQYQELFNNLENKITEEILDNSIRMAHFKPMKNVRGMYLENEELKNRNKNFEKQLEEEKNKNKEANKKIQEMQETINVQLAKIDSIESSRGWRLIVKIRKLFSYLQFWKKR